MTSTLKFTKPIEIVEDNGFGINDNQDSPKLESQKNSHLLDDGPNFF